jgi:glutathione peroxidase-family protein
MDRGLTRARLFLASVLALVAIISMFNSIRQLYPIVGMSFYDLSALTIDGKEYSFSTLRGKVVVIVNFESEPCGDTNQHQGLEALQQKYKDNGLVILGFPCNQFETQTLRADKALCEKSSFGATFQMMSQVDVNGNSAHIVYQYLKAVSGDRVRENYEKFLVHRSGTINGRVIAKATFEQLERLFIVKMLAEPVPDDVSHI